MSRVNSGLGIGPRPKLASWVHHHRQSAADSLHKMLLEPVSTFLTWLVVGIALALPTTLIVILDNVEQVAGRLEAPARFSLLLSETVDVDAAQDMATGLRARVDIDEVVFLPRDAALKAFAKDSGLESLIRTLDTNPLPNTLLVNPVSGLDSGRLASLATNLESMSGVDQLVFDTLWQSRLEAAIEFGNRLVYGLGLLMGLGAVLILANTIRLAIEARREEIVVIKLIGGGDGFARRPFLYTGLWSGIGGGVLASIVVVILSFFVEPPVKQLLVLYGNDASVLGLGVVGMLNLVMTGGVLGLLSAWQAAGLHLKKVEPR